MGSFNTPAGLSSADGAWVYADPKVLAHDARPVMAMNGDHDLFVPPAGGESRSRRAGGVARAG